MKKMLAMLLSVLMLVSCCAVAVSADDGIFNDATMDWGNGGDNDNQFNDDELDWSDYMGQFAIGSAAAMSGETVTIPVSIANNPGVVSLKLSVNYDASVLELISYEKGDFGSEDDNPGLSFGPLESPFVINWMDAVATENNVENGVIAYLTFKVKEDAPTCRSSLTITFNPNDVFGAGEDMPNMEFVAENGAIDITSTTPSGIPGDVNNDGKVNVRDLGLIQQSINGWEVTLNGDADVNNDNKVNVRDLGLIQQFINGWEVELK